MADSKMQVDEKVEIDEGLYSRQLYVLGHEAMKRMQASNVLIVGMKGLGVEIAKDLCLAGVKSVTVHDPEPVEIKDLSSQFYLREEDVGKPRAEVSQPRLAELNNYVPVHLNNTPDLLTDPSNLSSFQVVVLTNTPLETQIKINDYCHQNKIHFVSTDVRGLFGSIFCDFGEDFTVVDATGENAVHGIIADIDEEGLVTALDETRHGLETGDYVQFTEVEGIEGINNADPVEITVKGPYTFQIDRSKFLGQYQKGGLFTQVKMPKFVKFQSLAEQIKKPELLTSDFAKFDRPLQLHIAFQALDKFASKNGRLPAPMNASDAEEVYATAKELAQTYEDKPELDEKLIKEVAFQAQGDVPALSAIFGGLAAQEVLKAISGKFHPIVQFLYFDSLESLPTSVQRTEESCKPIGSRYDGQIAVFGKEFQEKIGNIKEFLVGAGAIGCEMLKNWAMIGLATGPEGKIYVTDMDSIEKSNLNRQFLFRPSDVGKLKSDCASDAVTVMNPDLSGKITAMRERVGPDTENIFNDDFWHALDGVTNALDNVDARTYVDRRCVFFMKPLLESGTLGTKGNTQVVLPRITESYSSSTDPPEQSFPMCTLRSFPNRIEHTIAWARDLFESFFAQPAQNVNLYLSQPNFIESTLKQAGNQKQILESIKEYLVDSKPLTFEECIQWARREFEKNFNNNIQQLLYNFPKDSKTSSGALFWSGPKRAPDPLTFDVNNKAHLDFIVAAANLHAFNYGLKGQSDDMAVYYKVLSDMVVPDFTPSSGVKIQEKDTDPDPNAAASTFADNDELQKIVEALPPPSSLAGYRLTPVEFEKDDPTNHHIDFITAASNLRAMNYGIQTADKHKTKFIAGRILPAMVTTTALVAGLVILELYKLIDGKTDPEQYKNGFVNLALPFFGFSEPISSPKGKYLGYDENGQKKEIEFDKLWDRFEVEGDVTLQEFLDIFEKKGLTITMLSSGVSLLYASFFPPKKRQERTVMRMTELVENVSKKAVPSHANSIIFEICADDLTEEDVEIPYVMLKLPAGKQVVVDKGEK